MNGFFASSVLAAPVLTLTCFMAALWLQKKTKLGFLNPAAVGSVFLIGFLLLFRVDYDAYAGGAGMISNLLTPATVCLAIPLYRCRALIKKYLVPILASVLVGTLTSLLGIKIMCSLLALSAEHTATLLPKSVTTAIAMGVSEELGGIPSVTAVCVIFTGALGAVIAEPLLKLLRIRSPEAKGLGIGTAAHAIGTSKALQMGPTEGAFSSLATALAGVMTVILAPFFL